MDLALLLREIELDVRELKCLANTYINHSHEVDGISELLCRNIRQMQGRLNHILQLVEEQTEKSPLLLNNCDDNNDLLSEEVPTANLSSILYPIEQVITSNFAEEPEEELLSKKIKSLDDTFEKSLTDNSSTVVGDRIMLATDLKKSISLNDSFRFSRELFGGDVNAMYQALEQISVMESLDMALSFLSEKIEIVEEDEATADFLSLLKKYFN